MTTHQAQQGPVVDSLMLTCAVRYALTRHSYVVGAALDWVRWAWPTLPGGIRAVLLRDVEEHLEQQASPPIGGLCEMDLRDWRDLAAWMRANP